MKKIILSLIIILFMLDVSAQEKSAESFYKEGMSRMNSNVLSARVIDDAIMNFRKALELNRDFKKAHLGLGLALYKKSLPILHKVVDKKVESKTRAYLTLPLSKLWIESIEHLKKSGDLGKKDYDSREALLLMYKFLGKEEEYLEVKRIKDSLSAPMIINRI